MASKLDPHVALIKGWPAAEPELIAIAIIGRLADLHPDQFGKKQHSIVQRLLRVLRRSSAQRSIADTAAEGYENLAQPPGAVDGSGYGGPDPPTAPLPVPGLNADPSANALTAIRLVTFSDAAIRPDRRPILTPSGDGFWRSRRRSWSGLRRRRERGLVCDRQLGS